MTSKLVWFKISQSTLRISCYPHELWGKFNEHNKYQNQWKACLLSAVKNSSSTTLLAQLVSGTNVNAVNGGVTIWSTYSWKTGIPVNLQIVADSFVKFYFFLTLLILTGCQFRGSVWLSNRTFVWAYLSCFPLMLTYLNEKCVFAIWLE